MTSQIKRDLATYAIFISVQFLFSGFHVLGFIGMKTMKAFVFATLRIGISTPILLIAAYIKDRFIPKWSDLPMLFLLGLLGVTTNQVLFLLGLYFTNPINAAVTQPAIPVFTAIIAIAIGHEKPGFLKPIAIIITCGGCTAMVLMQQGAQFVGKNAILGNICLFLNCLGFSIYLILQKPMLERIPPMTFTAWAFVSGLIGVVISLGVDMIWFEHFNFIDNLKEQTPIAWIAVVYAALAATCLAYALNTFGVKFSTATTAAVFVPFQPVASTILSVIFLRAVPSLGEYLGGLTIIIGLLIVTYARSREAKLEATQKLLEPIHADPDAVYLIDEDDPLYSSKQEDNSDSKYGSLDRKLSNEKAIN